MSQITAIITHPFGVFFSGALLAVLTSVVLSRYSCDSLIFWLPLATGTLSTLTVSVARLIPNPFVKTQS